MFSINAQMNEQTWKSIKDRKIKSKNHSNYETIMRKSPSNRLYKNPNNCLTLIPYYPFLKWNGIQMYTPIHYILNSTDWKDKVKNNF